MLPFDLDAPRLLALVLIFACWSLYEPILRRFGHGTLNAQLHVVRLRWMRMLLESHRENRVFDGILLGQLSGSISFFGSATLIVLAGLVGTLASINRVHESMNGIPFLPPITLPLFTIYFAALTLIMTFSFFCLRFAQTGLYDCVDRRIDGSQGFQRPFKSHDVANGNGFDRSCEKHEQRHSRLLFRCRRTVLVFGTVAHHRHDIGDQRCSALSPRFFARGTGD
jgi:hypothetical protein